jgi:HAMP domain-containing protein/putative methionine-R-sulfoxide reductase with GAF domain
MNMLHKIELKHKLTISSALLFLVFGLIGYLAYKNNAQSASNIDKLLDNIKLQSGINLIKDNIALDLQKITELGSLNSEADIENKWKEHTDIISEIEEATRIISGLSTEEAMEIIEVKNVYENLILPSYREIYKLKLRQQLLRAELTDSVNISSLKKIPAELNELSESIRTKIRVVQLKLDELSSKASAGLVDDLSRLRQESVSEMNQLMMFYLIATLISLIFLTLLFGVITKSIGKLSNSVSQLEGGDLSTRINISSKDEIGRMAKSMNHFIESIKNIAQQLNEIGRANFTGSYNLLSDKDELGKAFLDMKENLLQANQQAEKLREQEQVQNWATTGVAKFGEILRAQTDNNKELAYNIIKGFIEYLKANQGGIFIVNEEGQSPLLELMATYAYGRRKFKEEKIPFGVGLIGTCAIEGQSIYMTNIPNDYIRIESYLGEANPKALLLVPLRLDNKIFGVIEIASFNEFKDYEIKFVESLAETIASTISTAKINAKTAELLERSRLQSETMLAQEEEMRQNLEELQSTQEEAARREKLLVEELEETKRELQYIKNKHEIQ